MNNLNEQNKTRGLQMPPMLIIGILFFIFGFVSWINAILIPYFELACELTTTQAMLVPFVFYISYFFMALPSSFILKKTGFKNGMIVGLIIMAIGALVFVPAAKTRSYPLFLTGLFIIATGLTLLQTASNPYITILGPIESAAKRISIMGVCNKTAGAIAPLILVKAITKSPDEIDQLKKALPLFTIDQKTAALNELSGRLVLPYNIIILALLGLGLLIKFSHLPDIKEDDPAASGTSSTTTRKNIFHFPYLILGAITIFFAVSAEVIAVDTIIGYAQNIGLSFKEAKYFATYTLLIMIVSYLFGTVAIPKLITQRKALLFSAVGGLIFTLLALSFEGISSVWCIALLGLCNALLWPSIWPLAIEGLGSFTKTGSALLIMGIIGGAVMPLLFGRISDLANMQKAYTLLIPCYAFILFYAARGYRLGKTTL